MWGKKEQKTKNTRKKTDKKTKQKKQKQTKTQKNRKMKICTSEKNVETHQTVEEFLESVKISWQGKPGESGSRKKIMENTIPFCLPKSGKTQHCGAGRHARREEDRVGAFDMGVHCVE